MKPKLPWKQVKCMAEIDKFQSKLLFCGQCEHFNISLINTVFKPVSFYFCRCFSSYKLCNKIYGSENVKSYQSQCKNCKILMQL